MSDEQYPPAPAPPAAAYPPAPPPQPPAPASQRFPTWKQALVMLLGGLTLAISACFGCLFTVMSGNGRNTSLEGLALLLALIAGAGALAAVVGVVLVLMRMLRALFAKKDASGNTGSPS